MPRRVPFSVEDSQRLADLVVSLDLTQRALAESSRVGQPWLSYLLRAKRLTNTDAVKLERVANELASVVLQHLDAGSLAREQAQVALSFLARFAHVTAVAPLREDPPPGGPIPIDALPYVPREEDEFLANLLLTGSSDVLVWGPPQSGKSTALAFLQRRAYDLGIEAAWFDPQPSIETDDDVPDADAETASALCELLQAKWALGLPRFAPVNSIAKLNSWLVAELSRTPAKPRLLIIDDLANIGRGAPARWISRFVRYIANSRATQQLRISFAIGVTHRFGVKFAAQIASSSDHYWKRRIEVGWLKQPQVTTMVAQLRQHLDSDIDIDAFADDLFEIFQGQPFLTHAATIDHAFFADVITWMRHDTTHTSDALRQHTWYRRHRKAIELAILGSAGTPHGDIADLLDLFLKLCDPKPDDNPFDALTGSINSHHKTFLLKAGLVNEQGRPALALYRLIARDLAERIQ